MTKNRAEKIAVILYTVRDFAATPRDAAATLKRLRKIGYRNVQVSGGSFRAIPPADMKRMADDAGVAIVGAHVGFSEMLEDRDRVADMILMWGASHVAIPSFRPADAADPVKAWKGFAKDCNRIGKALARQGIHLQYHNHAFEFEKLGIRNGRGGRSAHDLLFASADPRYLQAELDLGWVARAGLDPAVAVRRHDGRVDQVHVKDWGMKGNEAIWRAIGEGNLNWSAIVPACRRAGVRMYIVEQDACPVTNDPFRSLQISFENLMAMPL